MTNQPLELRPDPYEGVANVDQDPCEPAGSFPFEDHEHAGVSELDVSGSPNTGSDFD